MNGMTCSFRLLDFGSLRALVSVKVAGMEVRDLKIVDEGDGKPYVASPVREVFRDGRKMYRPVIRFDKDRAGAEFQEWLLGEYRQALEGR